jgi:tetratricopeptide (TPR) repeat protein
MIAGLGSFAIPQNNIKGKDYSTLKIPLPRYEKGSKEVIKAFEEIDDIKEELENGKISLSVYESRMHDKYLYALRQINPSSEPYDLINGAILAYNLGQFEQSQRYLDSAYSNFPNHSSFIYYQQALLDLVDNKITSAMNNLDRAISQEPDELTPYLLKVQLAMDNNQMRVALETVEDGLKNYDDDNFQLNYLGGRITYQEGDYQKAIEYFKEGLSNTTVNEIEAECKILIAKSYSKSFDSSNADKWYKDALSEIDDDTPEGRKYIDHLIEVFKS